jgi:hypothetical protein
MQEFKVIRESGVAGAKPVEYFDREGLTESSKPRALTLESARCIAEHACRSTGLHSYVLTRSHEAAPFYNVLTFTPRYDREAPTGVVAEERGFAVDFAQAREG